MYNPVEGNEVECTRCDGLGEDRRGDYCRSCDGLGSVLVD